MSRDTGTKIMHRPAKPYLITQNILDLNKLTLRSLKYLDYINLSDTPKSVLKRVKQLKVLRKVSLDQWVSHKDVENALIPHHKTLKQVYMAWTKDLKKISKNQFSVDSYIIKVSDHSVYRSFLTKVSVKNLCLDFSSGEICQLEKFMIQGIFSVVRQLVRLKKLSNIDMKAPGISAEISYRLLRILDKALLTMPLSITVRLKMSILDSFLISPEQWGAFNSIPQRTVNIKTDDGDLLSKLFSSQISSFSQLRTHCISASPATERDLQDLRQFKLLESLHSLYFRVFSNPASDGKLTEYMFQNFTFPINLKKLDFKYGSFQHLHEVPIYSKILLLFAQKIKALQSLEHLRLSFYPETLERSERLHPILTSVLNNKPKLKSLHLSVCKKLGSEREYNDPEPFKINELFSQFCSIISSLSQINLQFAQLCFEEFNSSTLIAANDVSLSGKLIDFEGFRAFLQCLRPQDPDISALTLNIYGVEENEIGSLFKALTMPIKMEKIYIQIYPSFTGSSKIFGYLRILLTSLIGPKELSIRILELSMGKEAALVVCKSLENSERTLKKVKIEFKPKGGREWSFYIFEKVGNKYHVTSEYLAFNRRRIFLE